MAYTPCSGGDGAAKPVLAAGQHPAGDLADTASREYLLLRAAERGIVPYSATPATLRLQITPLTLELDANTRFSIGACNYGVTDNLGDGAYNLGDRIGISKDNVILSGNGQSTILNRMFRGAITTNFGTIHVTSNYNTIKNISIIRTTTASMMTDIRSIYIWKL